MFVEQVEQLRAGFEGDRARKRDTCKALESTDFQVRDQEVDGSNPFARQTASCARGQ